MGVMNMIQLVQFVLVISCDLVTTESLQDKGTGEEHPGTCFEGAELSVYRDELRHLWIFLHQDPSKIKSVINFLDNGCPGSDKQISSPTPSKPLTQPWAGVCFGAKDWGRHRDDLEHIKRLAERDPHVLLRLTDFLLYGCQAPTGSSLGPDTDGTKPHTESGSDYAEHGNSQEDPSGEVTKCSHCKIIRDLLKQHKHAGISKKKTSKLRISKSQNASKMEALKDDEPQAGEMEASKDDEPQAGEMEASKDDEPEASEMEAPKDYEPQVIHNVTVMEDQDPMFSQNSIEKEGSLKSSQNRNEKKDSNERPSAAYSQTILTNKKKM